MRKSLYPWCVQCRKPCKAFGRFGPYRVQRYRCRICLVTFSSGANIRISYKGIAVRIPEAFSKARQLFIQGYTTRYVAEQVGIHVKTSMAYRRIVKVERPIWCPCRKEAGHKGQCAFQISLNPVRQAYLAACAAQSERTRLARTISRQPILTTWPFVRAFDNDDYALLKIVNDAVPRSIPELVRQDACQDILLEILSGKLAVSDVVNRASGYIKQAYKFTPSKFGPLSLETLIFENRRLLDTLEG